MTHRTYIRSSRKARWSMSFVLICIQLLILTLLLHRFGSLYTPAALVLFAVGFLGILLACLLALWGLFQIWRKGYLGASRAILAIVFGMVVIAGPSLFFSKLLSLPAINDVTTDFSAPPSFEVLAEERTTGANSVIYPGDDFAQKQSAAYPDIQPLLLDRSAKEAYKLVQEAITALKWEVAARQAPGADGAAGWLEATDTTMVVGFVDDIVVRVVGDDSGTRIDVRSASRYGRHDLGQNAKRIRELFEQIQSGLVQGEQTVKLKEERKRHQAQRLQEEERKRRERAERQAAEAEAFQKTLLERQKQAQGQQNTQGQGGVPGQPASGQADASDVQQNQRAEQRPKETVVERPKRQRHTIEDWRAN